MYNKNLIRVVEGIKRIGGNKFCIMVPLLYAILVVVSWMEINPLLPKIAIVGIYNIWSIIFSIFMLEILLIGEFSILVMFGTPFGAKHIENKLREIKMCDSNGNTPLLLSKRKKGSFVTYKFFSTSFSKEDFINKIPNLRQILKGEVEMEWITEGEDPRYIIVKKFSVKKNFH